MTGRRLRIRVTLGLQTFSRVCCLLDQKTCLALMLIRMIPGEQESREYDEQ